MMTPATAIRRIYLAVALILLGAAAFAQSQPSNPQPQPAQPSPQSKILAVGAISINPCQDAKVLADWYSRLGIETKEFKGGYYGQIKTAAGPFFFAIHPKKSSAPPKCSPSISVVFRVENLDASLVALKSKELAPDSTEKSDAEGQFAHFHDPDGNEVTLWEGKI